MGITFADLVEKSRTFDIELDKGNALQVTYDPSALSPAKISRLNKQLRAVADDDEDNDENLFAVAKMFCSVVKDWSLEGPFGEDEDGEPLVAKGEPVPVEPDYVAWLPSPVIAHIIEKVGEDAAPKSKKRK